MSGTRTIEIWESEYDSTQLQKSNYNFHIAKSVFKGGELIFNTVWQSVSLQPDATVSWNVQYAFNWTKALPTTGATVVIGGKWQPCNKGQSVDINELGYFTNPVDSTAGWMSIGQNSFSPQGGGGIHIVVGVQNADTNKFDAIFVDPNELFTGGNGQFQPQEEVKWWYATGLSTGTMFTQLSSKVATQDMTNPASQTNQYYYSTTFTTDDGNWSISQYRPNAVFYAPVPMSLANGNGFLGQSDVPEISFWPVARFVTFSTVVAKAVQMKMTTEIQTDFRKKYQYCEIQWVSDFKMKWNFGPPKDVTAHTMLALGATDPDVKAIIDAELRVASVSTPAGETWTITTS